jgi:hypothetical protein
MVSDAELRIDCQENQGGWTCHVTVSEDGTSTQHDVSISEDDLTSYGVDSVSVVELVREAFAFLLEREPKESILQRFALSDIERYFPEFGRR